MSHIYRMYFDDRYGEGLAVREVARPKRGDCYSMGVKYEGPVLVCPQPSSLPICDGAKRSYTGLVTMNGPSRVKIPRAELRP